MLFFVLLMIKKIRYFLFSFIEINYHFFIAVFQFLALNKRTNKWDKLEVINNSLSGKEKQGCAATENKNH